MSHHLTGMGAGTGWGALAATAMLVLQLPILSSEVVTADALIWLPLGLMTLVVTYIVALLAALVIGWPVMAVLSALECADAEVTAMAGAAAGFGATLAIGLLNGGRLEGEWIMFALAALVGGGVAGAMWRIRAEQTTAPSSNWPPKCHRLDDSRWLR